RIDGRILGGRSQAGRASLREQHAFAFAGSDTVDCDDGTSRDLQLSFPTNVRLDQEQLHPAELRDLLRGDHVADDFGYEHERHLARASAQTCHAGNYFCSTALRLLCGRAITWTLTTSPAARPALAPA